METATSTQSTAQVYQKKAVIVPMGNMVFLEFYNSTHVYSIKGFDTRRKAENYAKKFSYVTVDQLPSNIRPYQNCD